MSEIVADPPRPPVVTCFLGVESNNLNGLILISFCFARVPARVSLPVT